MSTDLLKTFEEVTSVFIVGRRWFDKVNGNTYHSAEIYVNNDFVHKISCTYGYGDQYMWNGFDWLKNNGYLNYTGNPSAYCRENKIIYNHTVCDVKRKKDL